MSLDSKELEATDDRKTILFSIQPCVTGEQSPGCTMAYDEKHGMAHQLAELGVNVIEAGFPWISIANDVTKELLVRELAERAS